MNPTDNNQFSAGTPQPAPSVPASPPVTPVAPVMPVTPVAPIANDPLPNEDNPKKKYLFIGIFVVVIVLLLAGGYFIFAKKGNKGTGNAPSILQKIAVSDLSKYDKDTDSDGYPDFIETELGLDPNVSEYTRCKQGGCAESGAINTPSQKHNVLIILDASGSMAMGGSPNRMEIAKQAIKSYVSKASGNTQIGLMVYGHKGSNSTADKPVSCVSADVLGQVGSVNAQSIDSYLSSIAPVGWTPMGYALQQAASVFVGKENENNEIILLSDGEETCNSNPTGQAVALKNSAAKVTINVIGFAVDSNAQTQLNQISTSGGGSFAMANDYNELDRKFSDLYENGLKKYAELKCNLQNVDDFRICYNDSYNKVYDWINKRKLLLYDKKITQDEYTKLDDLSSKIFTQRTDVTSKETQDTINKFN